MEEAPPTPGTKPSALPRLSKLPVLHKRSSVLSLSTANDVPRPASQNNHTPRQPKRPSTAASVSSSTSTQQPPSRPVAASKQPPVRTTVGTSSRIAPKSSTISVKASAPRLSLRAGQPTVLSSPAKSTVSPTGGTDHSRFASLDNFRAASRQDSHNDSPIESTESAEPELPLIPRDRKGSRPSISDRTIESIQNLPSTPKDRRRSSFFSPVESPMGPPPRPTSSMSRNGSNPGSRPGTSDGNLTKPFGRPPSPAKQVPPPSSKSASRTSLGGFGFTPVGAARKPSIGAFTDKLKESKSAVAASPSPSKASVPRALPNGKTSSRMPPPSKTVASRSSKPRPALSDAFGPTIRTGNPPMPDANDSDVKPPAAASTVTKRAVSNPTSMSSAALRQQIAAAKAAARKEKAKHDSPQGISMNPNGSFESDLHVDPFNQAPKDEKHILRNRITTARVDGRLNIAAMGLKKVPDEVMTMYDAAVMEESKVSWAETVDLTRFIAADNEIAELGHDIFPDKSREDFEAEEESRGNQFGGLELLDLHNNLLSAVPTGLRRLERLTTLNLAYNKLENSACEGISQITSLKDLKLGHNALSGSLPASICQLPHLERLEIQANRLLGLPEALRELVSLKLLDVSDNQLTTLPMDALRELPLTELDASGNALIASLFPLGCTSAHPTLHTLKLANNSIAALTFSETLDLPQLRILDITNNHLTLLPPVAGWTELITLMVGDNKIAELPPGFSSLSKLRNVNFTSNDLRMLDPDIANMESLESLILAANPLREKKFLNMSAHDIKRDLKARIEPADEENGDDGAKPVLNESVNASGPLSPSTAWSLRSNGLLDLASQNVSDAANDSLGSFLRTNEVKLLHLQSNALTCIPPALWLAQDLRQLDLSVNPLGSNGADYLSAELDLPCLQYLDLSRCNISTLEPLLTNLLAPNLESLTLSANRLSGPLPSLRETYPFLTTLLAGDNRFTAVSAQALQGLHTVNLDGNNIDNLPADIGLLWDHGLRHLEVGRNAFRVPAWRVLEKGTEATMRWLRDRIPAPLPEGNGDGTG